MPSTSPTVVLSLGVPIEVVLDYRRLEAIEDAFGKTINTIAFTDFAAFSPERGADPEAIVAAMQKVSVRFVVTFIAACLGVPRENLGAIVPSDQVCKVFNQLGMAFLEAVREFNGLTASPAVKTGGSEADPPMPAAFPPASGSAG